METQDANTNARSTTTEPVTPRETTPTSRFLKLTSISIFQILLAIRLVNALTLSTFFQPDEYYQALEPAWQLAFDESSAAWITWEWRQHLRSAIHPALFAIVYKVAAGLSTFLDLKSSTCADVLLVAPKILQASFAAVTDFYTWKLARRTYGQDAPAAGAALLLTVINPWLWFCSTRTFSNGLETMLTIVALSYWPWDWICLQGNGKSGGFNGSVDGLGVGRLRIALLCAALATVLRPTNILIWVSIAGYTFQQTFQQNAKLDTGKVQTSSEKSGKRQTPWTKIYLVLRESVLCGSFVLGVSAFVDRIFYGRWTFPPYNFLYFNVFQSLAIFYGNNNWHYYLSEGYPLLLTTNILFALIGIMGALGIRTTSSPSLDQNSRIILRGLTIACLVLPVALSILSHKEVRFIYPLLPLLNIISAFVLADYARLALTTGTIYADHIRSERRRKRAILVFLSFWTLVIAIFTSHSHNSGLITLPNYLRKEFEMYYSPDAVPLFHDENLSHQVPNMTVGILMPCHSIPWRSHLQYPPSQSQVGIQAWALTCEPPLHITDPDEKQSYMDEADIFYDEPRIWLRQNMARTIPTIYHKNNQKNSSENKKRKPGIDVADKAMNFKNQKLWDSSDFPTNQPQQPGLDMTDLLPHLITSPPSSNHNYQNSTIPTITTNKPPKRPWPDYLIFFSNLEPLIHQTIRTYYNQNPNNVYAPCNRIHNSFVHDDWRRRGKIVVWCRYPDRIILDSLELSSPSSSCSSGGDDDTGGVGVNGGEGGGEVGKLPQPQRRMDTKFGFEVRGKKKKEEEEKMKRRRELERDVEEIKRAWAVDDKKDEERERKDVVVDDDEKKKKKKDKKVESAVEGRGNRGGTQTVVGG